MDIAEVCTEADGHLLFRPPKTKAGRRQVSVPRFAVEELAAHLGEWVDSDEKAFVFPAAESGPLRATSWRRRFWRPAVAAAGLEPLRPHEPRHTALALWIAQGENPRHVAMLAGHSSAAFTLDRYGHLLEGADDGLMGRLDAAHDELDGRASRSIGSRLGHARVTSIGQPSGDAP